MNGRQARIATLHRDRPRQVFVTRSVVALLLLVAISWLTAEADLLKWGSGQQLANVNRFLGELQPWPLQQAAAPTAFGARFNTAAHWFADMWRQKGADALATTLAISILAILLAGLGGSLLSLPAARNFARPQPFLPGGRRPATVVQTLWQVGYGVTRLLLMLMRALPEYIWAFLLLALLGPNVWPMILALALHNTGILGKLTAELVENIDARPLTALRGLGAKRIPLVAVAMVPMSLPRFLLYFFYRWETCVREATVLGMLGMASLGFWIVDARARNTYDEMLFFVVCGMILVLLGDLVSALVRHFLRRA